MCVWVASVATGVTLVKSSVSLRHLLLLYDWGPLPALAAPAASGLSFHQRRKTVLAQVPLES